MDLVAKEDLEDPEEDSAPAVRADLEARVDSEVRVDPVTDLAAREDLEDPEEDSVPAVRVDSALAIRVDSEVLAMDPAAKEDSEVRVDLVVLPVTAVKDPTTSRGQSSIRQSLSTSNIQTSPKPNFNSIVDLKINRSFCTKNKDSNYCLISVLLSRFAVKLSFREI